MGELILVPAAGSEGPGRNAVDTLEGTVGKVNFMKQQTYECYCRYCGYQKWENAMTKFEA